MKVVAASKAFFCVLLLLLFFPLRPCLSEDTGGGGSSFKEAVDLFQRGDTEGAIDLMKGVVAADPNNAEAYDRLGYFFLDKALFDDSLNAFSAALKINPALRTSKTGSGLALLKKGDVQGAEKMLIEALSLNPYPSATHYALGLVYEKQGNYEKAVSQFKNGIRTFKSGKK